MMGEKSEGRVFWKYTQWRSESQRAMSHESRAWRGIPLVFWWMLFVEDAVEPR